MIEQGLVIFASDNESLTFREPVYWHHKATASPCIGRGNPDYRQLNTKHMSDDCLHAYLAYGDKEGLWVE